MEKTVTILNEAGLHARPAGMFVKAASQFKSEIHLIYNDSSANAKSIMNLLSLALPKGATITISAQGEDENEAVETLVSLINSKFGE